MAAVVLCVLLGLVQAMKTNAAQTAESANTNDVVRMPCISER
jgi:hypothetical protein